jgi:hypothetical protein
VNVVRRGTEAEEGHVGATRVEQLEGLLAALPVDDPVHGLASDVGQPVLLQRLSKRTAITITITATTITTTEL